MRARLVLAAGVAVALLTAPASASALTSVEGHWDTFTGSGFKRAGDATSDFSPGDGPNGVWQLLPTSTSTPELGFVKERNTGSGKVEVHWDTLSNGSYHRVGSYTSDFSPGDAANGTFDLFGSANGAPELGFVKVRNTGSGKVEAHWDTLSNGSYHRTGSYTSDFSPGDANNGTWQLLPTSTSTPELGFVKERNTGSGKVEVHWDALSNGSYHRVGSYTSDFSPGDAANGTFDLFGSANGAPELGFVKVRNTGSGKVEAHWDTLSNGSYHRVGSYTSDFNPADANNGTWLLLPTSTSTPELGFVKTTQPSPRSTAPPHTTPVVTVIPRPRAKRHVKVRIAISWVWRGNHTWLERIRVGRLAKHGRLTISCRGRGCPTPHARAARRQGVKALARSLAKARYTAGDRLLVTVAVPGLIAERAEIRIRRGKLPAVRLL